MRLLKNKLFLLFTVMLMFLGNRLATAQQKDTITVYANQDSVKISKYIYGQFAEDLGRGNYGGIWVGPHSNISNYDGIRKDVVQALRKLNVPFVRWPGGCFADNYHWKDGAGPRGDRPNRIRSGNVIDTNAFGTQEFMRFCKLIGAQPYLSGNLGSGTPREMQQWLEYLTYPGNSNLAKMRARDGHPKPYDITFWGVGNESWGCGGNMSPKYYANLYKRYTTFLHNYGKNPLFLVASGPGGDNYNMTRILMQQIGPALPAYAKPMDGLSLHYYSNPGWSNPWGRGPSINFSEKHYFGGLKAALHIDQLIKRHSTIMDQYDPKKHVALVVDEWGIWTDPLPGTHPVLYQQNSLRDALIASSTLDIFNKHADRVKMANIAQMVNVLQSMLLTKGKQMIKTPTYYVFKMYKVHMGATYLPMNIHAAKYTFKGQSISSLSGTASRDSTGAIHLTLSNLNAHKKQKISIELRGAKIYSISSGTILTADHFDAINTFANSNNVQPKSFDGAHVKEEKLTVNLPSKSIVSLELK